jgi:hypothetical protein
MREFFPGILRGQVKVTYKVKHLRELQIVELTLSGVISGADLRASTTECISLQRLSGITRFLIDLDGWEVVASAYDIYELPAHIYGREGVNPATRIAVILPSSVSGQQAAQDYEVMCQNRGWHVCVLRDRESAIDWLTGTARSGRSTHR